MPTGNLQVYRAQGGELNCCCSCWPSQLGWDALIFFVAKSIRSLGTITGAIQSLHSYQALAVLERVMICYLETEMPNQPRHLHISW